MAGKRQQAAHHYYSVFYDLHGQVEMAWFGYSARQASWEFYKAIQAAKYKPEARAVDLRRDSVEVASVPIKVEVPA